MRSIDNVVCPTDLSPGSDAALGYAAAFAVAKDARLTIVTWHGEDGDSTPRTNVEALFAESLALNVDPGVLAVLRWDGVVLGGPGPAEAIARAAAERRADIIVMRSRRRPLRAALLGSTAEAVCRIAPCPVLVTHPDGKPKGIDAHCFRKILVAYDFWDDSEIALQHALQLAVARDAELHLVHAITPPDPGVPELAWNRLASEGQLHRLEGRLAGAVPPAVARGVRVIPHVVIGHPYREILALAEDLDIDLVCMGAKGRDSGARSLFGSNSDRVLRQSPCPVLVARPLRPLLAKLETRPDNNSHGATRH